MQVTKNNLTLFDAVSITSNMKNFQFKISESYRKLLFSTKCAEICDVDYDFFKCGFATEKSISIRTRDKSTSHLINNFIRWLLNTFKIKDFVIFPQNFELKTIKHLDLEIQEGINISNFNLEIEEKKEFKCPICFENYSAVENRIVCTPFDIGEENDKHEICIDCIKGIAMAALTDTPLANSGIGFPCCVPECKNVFLMSKILHWQKKAQFCKKRTGFLKKRQES
uniref:Uncharacterized protein n=1 Tax=Panagrolaimus sp. JU765 TaxID=591449 RepID=A0AC34PWP6_9BILA